MTRQNGKSELSRRHFLGGVATLTTLAASTLSASAQSSLQAIINSPRRGNWEDQFDAKNSRATTDVATRIPVTSQATVGFVERAIVKYQGIVARGGWPMIPADKKLQLGSIEPEVRLLRQRLMVSGDLDAAGGISNSFDSYVDGAVKKFQARHGLPADGVIGSFTFQALNVPADIRLGQLETNLVRLRSMSGSLGERYVMVNIPAAKIEAVENGRVVQRHTAIVGQIDRQTPIFNSKIHEIILNPYWTAPRSIIERDIVPLMRKDPTYLERNSIRLIDNKGNEVDPQTIDWFAEEAPNLIFRQDPGKINAMASTKINFHNPYAVYMHDTPQKSLFNKLMRFESSGCVRVQNVRDLTTWLLRDTPGWSRQQIEATIQTGKNMPILLTKPVPVYFVYITAWASEDGVVQFRNDVYKRDGADVLALR